MKILSKEANVKVKPYYGLIIFCAVMVLMIIVAPPIQARLGMYGVAITELIILITGIIPIFILKLDIKDVLPVKRPKLLQLIGVIVLWIATYILTLTVALVIQYFFPGFAKVGNSLQNVFVSVPMAIALFIIGLMPAVCEEILHRGIILYTFKNIKNKWVTILCMGLIFGIFHMDMYRFLPTALIGVVLTYIMITTKNIILPMLFHLINNSFTVCLSFAIQNINTTTTANTTNTSSLISIGGGLILCSIVPLMFLLGARLIKNNQNKELDESNNTNVRKITKILVALVISAVIGISGFVLVIANANIVMNQSINQKINPSVKDFELPLKINRTGTYNMDVTMYNERGISDFIIKNQTGDTIVEFSAGDIRYNKTDLQLEKGEYTIIIDLHLDDADTYYESKGYTKQQMKENLGFDVDINKYTEFKLNVKIY